MVRAREMRLKTAGGPAAFGKCGWILATLALAACGPRAPEGSTVLLAARLYVAPDMAPIDDGALLMREGRILEAGPRDAVATRGALRLPQCDGGVVAAGFQNSHVHFTQPAYADAATRDAAELEAALRDMLTRFGFTTVVDLASNLANTAALRGRIESGEIAGPRILTAGAPLYPRDGIPIYLRDLAPAVLARMPQPRTVGEALAALQRNFDGGADATKLFLVTPQGGGATASMDAEIATAAVAETHRRGLPVFAHPTDIEGIELALETGVDTLAHTTIARGSAVWDDALVAHLVAQDVALIPTLMLWRYELEREPLLAKFVGGATDDGIGQLRTFAAAGGKVVFGTDVGYMERYDPTEEYGLMARALTAMQILASLTTEPAARWQEGEARGRIAPGMAADLVVLESDPAADAADFARVRCTIRGGRVIYATAAR